MLSGAKFIKAGGGALRASHLVSEQIGRLRLNAIWSAFLPTTTRSMFEFSGILIILGALIGGLKIEQSSPAQILVLIGLMARLLPRLMNLQMFHNSLNLTAPAYAVLTQAQARFAMYRESRRSGTITDVDRLLPADIRAKNLVMRYGEKTVLNDITFTLPASQVIGFVGPSGAGKSTLVDLLIGLIAPSGGQITAGDVRLGDIDVTAWRKKIGYVSQDTFLFHDTLFNNIRWSTPDASMEEVKAAARATGMDRFVSSLPDGYNTIVGDRGAKLSGGQRQRISIARALVHRPALLVLDEATSALDSLSEKEVMDVINGLKGSMTIVIVAHRLATVRDADIIYVLDHGRIVEQGSWSTLSGDKALFHRLMQAQAV
jgi:ATP-binding cassette subfamily C protein